MRIVLLTHWLSNRGGGIPVVVAALARAMAADPELDVHVCGLVADQSEAFDQDWGKANVHPVVPRESRVIGYAPAIDMLLARLRPDIVHLHGLWTYESIAASRWRARSATGRLVISPHGMLEPWALANSGLKKRIASAVFQRKACGRADLLHGLTPSEAAEIGAYCGARPVALVPNGVDLPADAAREDAGGGSRRLLYLGRLHPKKNLGFLLEAWAAAGSATQGWRLEIAGWDQGGTEAALKQKAADLGLDASVDFPGPLFGAAKQAAYSAADAFVLPSLSEGLPMVVLEAWSNGLPVLMTDACNLPDGFAAGAAQRMRVDPPEAGARDLGDFLAHEPEAMQMMGSAGLELARCTYLWDVVARRFRVGYSWVLGRADRPDFVNGG